MHCPVTVVGTVTVEAEPPGEATVTVDVWHTLPGPVMVTVPDGPLGPVTVTVEGPLQEPGTVRVDGATSLQEGETVTVEGGKAGPVTVHDPGLVSVRVMVAAPPLPPQEVIVTGASHVADPGLVMVIVEGWQTPPTEELPPPPTEELLLPP